MAVRKLELEIKVCGECPYCYYSSPYLNNSNKNRAFCTLIPGRKLLLEKERDDFSFDMFKIEIPDICLLEIVSQN